MRLKCVAAKLNVPAATLYAPPKMMTTAKARKNFGQNWLSGVLETQLGYILVGFAYIQRPNATNSRPAITGKVAATIVLGHFSDVGQRQQFVVANAN
jgi:hypothetical protein